MLTGETKSILLFLFGCLVVRISLVVLANKIQIEYLPYLGYLALIPAIGFLYIYLTDSRKKGPETFGQPIWWNHLRPIHSILYFLFAYNAIMKNTNSYIYLLLDVVLGFIAFIHHHFLYFKK